MDKTQRRQYSRKYYKNKVPRTEIMGLLVWILLILNTASDENTHIKAYYCEILENQGEENIENFQKGRNEN